MLAPAQCYQGELHQNHCNVWYDPKYMYARDGSISYELDFMSDNEHNHAFASVYKGRVVGFIGYSINLEARSAYDLFVESYDLGNPVFIRDVFHAICNLFVLYKFNRLEWFSVDKNPAIRHYRKFISVCGGREVGTFKDRVRLMNGELADHVYFEILREDFMKWRNSR